MNNGNIESEEQNLGIEDDLEWSDGQREAIEHRGSHIQIIACAGSGKTSTVSRRIAEMVRDGVDRDTVVAITFTNKAAEEFKVRIRREMERVNPDDPPLGNMFVGTIHSFCSKLLHDLDPSTRSYDVIGKNGLMAFLMQHFSGLGLNRLSTRGLGRHKIVEWFVEDANTIRRENLEQRIRQLDDPRVMVFMEVYENYRELMERDHFFDYEELIYRTTRILEEHPNLLDEVRQRYRHFVVDEYQDTDRAQERLLELLVGDSGTLCVVGDDDQSIYRWRGGRPEIFLDFSDKFIAEIVRLEENFRSTRPIVEIADHVIRKNQMRVKKELSWGVEGEIGDVYHLYFEGDSEEIRYICDKIQHLLGTSYDDGRGNERILTYGDIAILFRRKRDMARLIEEFERRDIPFTAKGQATLFSRPETELIRRSFAYIARGQHPNITIVDPTNDENFVVEEDDLRNMIGVSNLLREREDTIIEGLNTMRSWYKTPTSRRIIPQREFQKILELMGAGEVEFPEPIMYEFGQISRILKDFETVYRLVFPDQIRDLVEFLNWANESAESAVDDPTMLDAVNLMTIHRAKGTEFPIVFVPGLTRIKFSSTSHPFPNRWGGREYIPEDIFNYEDYEEGEEDARRLFYVAITRSRKYLFLTGAKRNRGYRNIQNPSLYFAEVGEVQNPCIVRERIADPTPRTRGAIEGTFGAMVYPTSYVDLRYYLRCPNDYKMRRIFGFCPPVDSGFGYGFAVHGILREIHERYQEDEESILPSSGEIHEMVWNHGKFFLRYSAGEVEENLRKSAERILVRYITEYQRDILLTYKPEVPFEFLIEDRKNDITALVSGQIDLLQKVDPDTGEVREINVVDFKTEHQPDSEFDPRIRDARFQVRLYAIATHDMDLQTADGYVHYLTEGRRDRVDMGEPLLDQVKEVVRRNVRKIIRREFPATPSGENCENCDYRRICPYRIVGGP